MKTQSTTFDDAAGRTWSCRVDWAAMRRSKAAGVDLSKYEEHLEAFYMLGPELIDALWAVVSPQGKNPGMVETLVQFEQSLTGEHLERARDALAAGVCEFYPESRAAHIKAAVQAVEEQVQKILSNYSFTSSQEGSG